MSGEKDPREQEEKRKAHFAAAKKAALGFAAEQGGRCPMGDMHSFCESKFFIAHQSFSRLLEECVAEGLVRVEGYEITLTEKGRTLTGGEGSS